MRWATWAATGSSATCPNCRPRHVRSTPACCTLRSPARARHHRVTGLQQQVHQPPVRPLDRVRDTGRVPVSGQAPDQPGDPVRSALCAMVNSAVIFPAATITHTAWVAAAQSILVKNSASGSASDTVSHHGGSDDPARRPATGRSLTGALRRVPLLPVRSPARTGGGSVMVAVSQRPNRAVTPALAEFQQRAHCRCPC